MASAAKPPPLVLAVLTADAVHRDPATGKLSILGVVNEVRAASYPATLPFLAVYLAVTDGHGEVRLRVRVVDAADGDTEVAGGTLAAAFDGPLVVAEIVLDMPGLTFPRAGEYRLQVVHGDAVLAERRLMAHTTHTPHLVG
jgi:hypothetical protein